MKFKVVPKLTTFSAPAAKQFKSRNWSGKASPSASRNQSSPAQACGIKRNVTAFRPVAAAGLLTLIALCLTLASAQDSSRQQITRDGIAVDFTIAPIKKDSGSPELVEGADAVVRFSITDTAGRAPLTGLRPSAWLDWRRRDQPDEAKACQLKIQSFLQGKLSARPVTDLNSYYLLALNQEASISVIDPLLGYGASKLLALVLLKSPGADWTLSRDQQRLFVALPQSGQVAVVDTATWKVSANIDAGEQPARLALQPDGRYLWVSSRNKDSVTVIDTATLKVAAQIQTGAGPHEITFSRDDRFAFVANRQDGTVLVIEVQRLARLRNIRAGRALVATAYSPMSQALYVIGDEGIISVIDESHPEPLAQIKYEPGLSAISFAPDGRYALLANAKTNTVTVLDAATNRLLQKAEVGPRPAQITFTRTFAFVLSAGTEEVSVIELKTVGKDEPLHVTKFPGGQFAPERAGSLLAAGLMTPAPEGNAVLLANPADQMIYYYAEGMAAPMGSFQNYRRTPRAVLVQDRSLRETAPGVYETTVKLTQAGSLELAFLLDSPRVIHCFSFSVKANPALEKMRAPLALQIEPLDSNSEIIAGQPWRFRFRLKDRISGETKADLTDLRVLALLAPGVWHKREPARHIGNGIYELTLAVPQPGICYFFVESQSLNLKFNQLQPLILQATDQSQESKPR